MTPPAIRSARKAKVVRNDTISHALGVTDREAETLPSFHPTPDPPIQRPATDEERRDTIKIIIETYTAAGLPIPSPASILPELQLAGFEATRVTIWRDYKKLGVDTNRKGGRPVKTTLF